MKRIAVSSASLWTWVCVLCVVVNFLVKPVDSNDSWWPMAVARNLSRTRDFWAPDRFSFTQDGKFFPFQPWLSGWLMYVLHAAGGFSLLVLALALGVSAAFYGFIRYLHSCFPARARSAAMCVALVTLPLCSGFLCARTQTLVIPVFAAFLCIVHGWWSGTARVERLKWLPWLMLLWVNMHGSFVVGLALVSAATLGRGSRNFREWKWVAACFAVTFVNPLGPRVYAYVARILTAPVIHAHVEEWRPFHLSFGPQAYWFYGACLLALWVIGRGHKKNPVGSAVLLGSLAMALLQARHVIWFAFVLPLALLEILPNEAPSSNEERRRFLNGVLLAALAGVAVILFFRFRARAEITPPVLERLARLEPRPRHLFHALDISGEMMWFAPEQKVFIDPRLESYDDSVSRDYVDFSSGRRAQELAEKYGIDGFLLSKTEQPALLTWVASNGAWRREFVDAEYSLWTRVP